MSADCSDQDDGVLRVAEGATGGEVVGGGAGRGGDADAVGLDGGEVFVVAEDLDGGHCCCHSSANSLSPLVPGIWRWHTWIRAPVHDDVIQYLKRPIRLMRVVVLSLFSDQLLD